MNVLIISQYYPPETGACSGRISGFAQGLVSQGHKVTVITGFPNYPEQKLYPGYRRSWCKQDADGGVQLLRTWLTIFYPKRPIFRLLNYLGFFLSSLYAGLFRVKNADVVVATSGPILVGFTGSLISICKRKPFVLDLRDVWPERIVAAGEFKNPIAILVLEFIEKFIYQRAQTIVCVTKGVQQNLKAKGISEKKLCVITNGTNIQIFTGKSSLNGEIFAKLGIPHKAFIVVYAGTMGYFQDHDLFLRAAEKLRQYPDIYFLLIGDGVKRKKITESVNELGLTNVRFLPNLPPKQLAEVLPLAHVGVNSNTPIQHNSMAIPVKMFDFMACGLPVVLANDGEAKEILEECRCGFCIPPGDSSSFVEALLKLYRNPEMREHMGKEGRKLVEEKFSIQDLSHKFGDLLKRLN